MASSSMSLGGRVEQTVEVAARRRLLMNAAEQLGWVAIFFLAGLIVLMLAGSLIFDWRWLLLLVLTGTVLGAYRVRQHRLPRYAVAQMLDRRLHLSDTLSTAYYLRSRSGEQTPDPSSSAFAQALFAQADRMAEMVQPSQMFSFSGYRVWSIAGALALVCMCLFGVRYLVTESLSLKPALVPLQLSPVIARIHELVTPARKAPPLAATSQPASKADNANGREAEKPAAPENVPAPPPAVSTASSEGTSAGSQMTHESAKNGNEGPSQEKAGESASAAKQDAPRDPNTAASAQPGTSEKPGASQQQPQTKEQRAGSQDSPPGVVSRMKDALSSMMAKMQGANAAQQPKAGQQESSDPKSSQQAQASGRAQQGNQSQQQQSQNQASNPNETAEGQAQGQTAEKQGTTQGKSSDQSAQKGSDAHSGVGQQDGDKDIKNAEQLKAMGKLAEIIGKRSANLTGDMTVETPSGKQQLKTAYSQHVGEHSDSGGEINHNQVPLAYQQYVREYMEQVRKQDKGDH